MKTDIVNSLFPNFPFWCHFLKLNYWIDRIRYRVNFWTWLRFDIKLGIILQWIYSIAGLKTEKKKSIINYSFRFAILHCKNFVSYIGEHNTKESLCVARAIVGGRGREQWYRVWDVWAQFVHWTVKKSNMSAEWSFRCMTDSIFISFIFLGGGLWIDFQFQGIGCSFFFSAPFLRSRCEPKICVQVFWWTLRSFWNANVNKKKTKVFPLGKCVKRARYASLTSIKFNFFWNVLNNFNSVCCFSYFLGHFIGKFITREKKNCVWYVQWNSKIIPIFIKLSSDTHISEVRKWVSRVVANQSNCHQNLWNPKSTPTRN